MTLQRRKAALSPKKRFALGSTLCFSFTAKEKLI